MFQLKSNSRTKSRNNFFLQPKIQPKVEIRAPGDKFEREADAIASQVLLMPQPEFALQRKCASCEEEELQMKSIPGSNLQIQPIEEEEEETAQPKLRMQPIEEEELLQPKSDKTSHTDTDTISSSLGRSKNSGAHLPESTNQFMSRAFDSDFSKVKVHTDSSAVQMNQQLGAKAFTHGNSIYFNKGEYNPSSSAGKQLLAHELTHVVQQTGCVSQNQIQRDLAIPPTVSDPTLATLTTRQRSSARRFNGYIFTDAEEIGEIRDVLGVSRTPADLDDAFTDAVLRYQASFGLSQDGKLGRDTAGRLATEITAEADRLSDPATGTLRRRVARRLQLRSMVGRRSGVIVHQGFVGPEDRPRGAVTIRINADESALHTGAPRAISLDYTGSDANQINWLQFVSREMYGFQPGSRERHYNTGDVTTLGGTYAYSRPGARTWNLDTLSTTSPFYNAGGLSQRTAGRSLVMIDQPGAATAASLTTLATSVDPTMDRIRVRITFDAYAVKGNNVVYRVRWTGFYRISITTPSTSDISYRTGFTGRTSRILAGQRTELNSEFPANTIR